MHSFEIIGPNGKPSFESNTKSLWNIVKVPKKGAVMASLIEEKEDTLTFRITSQGDFIIGLAQDLVITPHGLRLNGSCSPTEVSNPPKLRELSYSCRRKSIVQYELVCDAKKSTAVVIFSKDGEIVPFSFIPASI